jgi:hypothetical protein
MSAIAEMIAHLRAQTMARTLVQKRRTASRKAWRVRKRMAASRAHVRRETFAKAA